MTITRTAAATPANPAHRAQSARVGLFLGRGDTSTPIGQLSTYPDTPPPDPVTVATLPIGRQLLTATTEHDYRAALVAFAAAWCAGGFGDTHCDHTDPPPDPGTCPPADGDNIQPTHNPSELRHQEHTMTTTFTTTAHAHGSCSRTPTPRSKNSRPGASTWYSTSEVATLANTELGGYDVFVVMDGPATVADIVGTLGQIPIFE
ncbi:hypothetical protein [Amycolatopsis palatopharyngis]|uniref:hypothetical protein n=1 Tax=Amycolatopsis palatopharyngis TaxID=187982 RepID=UPI000E233B09|nr:hypothetical protein [Amycolatopsis palatopharyngis]